MQTVVQDTGVVFHGVRSMKSFIYQIISVDVLLDEMVKRNLQLGDEGKQNPVK